MTTPSAANRDTRPGCDGDDCRSRSPWPLHHVRHHSAYSHLCTSCVLRYHPSAFCFVCFGVIDFPPPSLARCSKCRAVAHLDCLSSPAAVAHCLCPSCSSPQGFSYFPPDERPPSDGRRHTVDLRSAKALLTASHLAAASMTRAATTARAECEKKVREAAVARKQARAKIDWVATLSKRGTQNLNKSKTAERKELNNLLSNAENQPNAKELNNLLSNAENQPNAVNGMHNDLTPARQEHVESEMKGSSSCSGVQEEDRGLLEESVVDPWMHRLSQDAAVPEANAGGTFSVMPNTGRLRS